MLITFIFIVIRIQSVFITEKLKKFNFPQGIVVLFPRIIRIWCIRFTFASFY